MTSNKIEAEQEVNLKENGNVVQVQFQLNAYHTLWNLKISLNKEAENLHENFILWNMNSSLKTIDWEHAGIYTHTNSS